MKTSNSTNGGQSNGTATGRYFESVKQLREILGDDVLLLRCKLQTKKPVGAWGKLTVASMTPDYLKKLSNPPTLETKLLVNDTEIQSYGVTESQSHGVAESRRNRCY